MNYYRLMSLFVRVPALATTVLAGLVACAQVAPSPSSAASAPPPPAETAPSPLTPAAALANTDDKKVIRNSRLGAQLMYELLVAEISFRTGDAPGAAAFMLDIARHEGDESLYERATQMAIEARAGNLAQDATRAWIKAYPDSLKAARYQLQVAIALGRISQSTAPLKAMLNALPDGEKASFIIALPALYQNVGDKNAATAAVQDALSDATDSKTLGAAAWTTIGRMRMRAGDDAGALSAAALGQNADPGSPWPPLLALQLFAVNQDADAEPIIKRYLARADTGPEIRSDYARALAELGRNTDAQAQFTLLTQRNPAYAEGWLDQGLFYADQNQDGPAEKALTHFLDLRKAEKLPDNSGQRIAGINQAHLTLAKIAQRRGDDAAAEVELAQVRSPDMALAVAVQRANLLAQKGQLDKARQVIEAVPERAPGDARLKLLAEAQLLRDNGQASTAYQMLTDALAKSPDDDQILYDAAMTAERLGKFDDMERLLRQVIALRPDSAYAYNALGYSLADRNIRLPEAKQLIEKAVGLAPDDGYVQDSLGWVEYRLGHLEQARTILQGAYNKQHDTEIAAHLGEVLWVLGQHGQAEAVWKQGLRRDAHNAVLLETMKRLHARP
ncbi:MAG: tetratricopeptide repeat protein [Burkholderiaceae bacterium]|nr:MAG: tetratricopeptide repeat protein [Burkholderiaceae bacterium]